MKLSEDQKKVLNQTQDAVLDSFRTAQPATGTANSVLSSVASLPDDKLSQLGLVGKILSKFGKSVNLKHPEVSQLTSGDEWSKASADISACLKGDSVSLDKHKGTILRQFGNIKPRFIKNTKEREEAREAKKSTAKVTLKQVFAVGEDGFFAKPWDFSIYTRNSDAHIKVIEGLDKQRKVFSEHSMPEMAGTIAKRITDVESLKKESYNGFCRITPADASVISARFHGLRWSENAFITASSKFFDSETFWEKATSKNDEDKKAIDIKKLVVFKDKKIASFDSMTFSYQPRLYPLSVVSQMAKMPSKVKSIIAKLEAMPEAGGGAIFDYYWVVVPGVSLNHPLLKTESQWKFWEDQSECLFSTEDAATFELDKRMINKEIFIPTVLGEKDGLCYFVCLWC